MSTYYEIVCHKHKEKADLFMVSGFSGTTMISDNPTAGFCLTHKNCEFNVISENNNDCDEYKKWDSSNWEEMIDYGSKG